MALMGLVGDAIDLLPFVSCVGETVRAVKTTDNIVDTVKKADRVVDAVDDFHDSAKAVDHATDKVIENTHTYFVGQTGLLVHNVCGDAYSTLRSMAKSERKPILWQDAMAYCELSQEYGVNYHLPMTHPNRNGIWSHTLHINVAGVHIAVMQ